MIKHIVNWKLKDFAEGKTKLENSNKMKKDLEGLVGKIDVIKSLEVGINIKEDPQNYDVVLVSEFKSMEDLKIYANDPRHVEVGRYIKLIVESRVAVDYEFK